MSSTNEKVRLMRESDARLAAEKKNKPKLNKRDKSFRDILHKIRSNRETGECYISCFMGKF